MFDVNEAVGWPTWNNPQRRTMLETRNFSENVFHPDDEINVGNVKIAVVGPLTPKIIQALLSELPANRIDDLEKDLKKQQSYLDGLVKANATDRTAQYERSQAEEQLDRMKKTVAELAEKYQAFNPGTPGSSGYAYIDGETGEEQYSVMRVYLIGAAYAYVFGSTEKINTAKSIENHRKNISSMIRDFYPEKIMRYRRAWASAFLTDSYPMMGKH